MLTTLLESGAKKKRSRAGLAASVVIHGALIAAGIAASSHVATATLEKPKAENIEFVAPPPPKPPEPEKVYTAPKPKPPEAKPAVKKARPRPAAPRMQAPKPAAPRPAAAAPAPANVPVLNVPVAVPTTISAPDLSAIPTVSDVVARASDIGGSSSAKASGSGSGRTTSDSDGDVAVSASRGDGSAWGEDQVDRAVQQQGSVSLRYPPRLQSANVSGTVMMRFIVGANGRVEMGSVQVLDSPHDEFTDAVKDALRKMRYRPAEVRGTKVRQLVEQSFHFKLQR